MELVLQWSQNWNDCGVRACGRAGWHRDGHRFIIESLFQNIDGHGYTATAGTGVGVGRLKEMQR